MSEIVLAILPAWIFQLLCNIFSTCLLLFHLFRIFFYFVCEPTTEQSKQCLVLCIDKFELSI